MSGRAIPVPTPWTRRPRTSREKCGAAAHMTVPVRKAAMARANRVLVRRRRWRKEETGIIVARTRR